MFLESLLADHFWLCSTLFCDTNKSMYTSSFVCNALFLKLNTHFLTVFCSGKKLKLSTVLNKITPYLLIINKYMVMNFECSMFTKAALSMLLVQLNHQAKQQLAKNLSELIGLDNPLQDGGCKIVALNGHLLVELVLALVYLSSI